ncbi:MULTISPECIES: META domain-containing protein [unclassified Halomonas]|uniref:META domain-containing protein n=1 Tax=unclassified Halomonas TaxID=2609666 RepID=UPI0020A02BB3|nr:MULTISPECIES: META domain-containing protein [unclassified Halomonas]MCP1315340.1 META domain-containing protein [Halomonas sp. 707D7]MCP1326560.1 META domain-containing protein [Halomonas sp. 707D4]
MKAKYLISASFASVLVLNGCTSLNASSRDTAPQAPLENTYWKLVTVGEQPATVSDQAREAYLVLHAEETRVAGSTGCNNLMGGYALKDNQLSFSALATTRMACASPQMTLERDFLQALKRVARWEVVGETLTLDDAQGQPVAHFEAVYLY